MSKHCAKSCGTCSSGLKDVLGIFKNYDNLYKEHDLSLMKINLESIFNKIQDTELIKNINSLPSNDIVRTK